MIIEQAFYNLPEIMTGSGYADQDVEAGIVASYSLALLQELNGRNVAIPISAINAEKRYDKGSDKHRCDLFVNLWKRLYVGSEFYGEYGFRMYNWIEAKYFRHETAKTKSTSQFLADLIRLVVLPDEYGANENIVAEDAKSFIGRYMLHVYEGDPTRTTILVGDVKASDAKKRRPWLISIVTPGAQKLVFKLDKEKDSFFKYIGNPLLKNVKLSIEVTNHVIEPSIKNANGRISDKQYVFVLTRVVRATIEYNGNKLTLKDDMTFSTDPLGMRLTIRREIADLLGTNQAGRQATATATTPTGGGNASTKPIPKKKAAKVAGKVTKNKASGSNKKSAGANQKK